MQSYIGVEDNFLLENGYLVARLEELVIAAEDTKHFTTDHINEMFRIMHTIKSSAGIMMYDNISLLAHKLEDVFYYLREACPESVPHDKLVEGILATADFITAELMKIQAGHPADGNAADIVASLECFLVSVRESIVQKGAPDMPEPAYSVPSHFYIAPKADEVVKYYRIDIYYQLGTQMSNVRAYMVILALRDAAEEMIYTPEEILSDHETAGTIMRDGFHIQLRSRCEKEELWALIEDSSGGKDIQIQESSVEEFLLGFQEPEKDSLVIRLDDEWMAEQEKEELMPGDYVIRKAAGKGKVLQRNHSRVTSLQEMIHIPLEKFEDFSREMEKLIPYRNGADELSEVIDRLLDRMQSIRKVPIRGIFSKMNRAVDDISRKLNKLVELDTEGDETEIERSIAGAVSGCLVHILRNAVDHGIEDKRERLDAGKTAKGHILLEAGRQGDGVYISVTDDGRGLNAERIFEVASERGLTAGRERDALTVQDIYQFIMAPGFSTTRQVTEYSGRGVGLDAVTQNILSLGGWLEVDSIPGQGTEITMRIPQKQFNQ